MKKTKFSVNSYNGEYEVSIQGGAVVDNWESTLYEIDSETLFLIVDKRIAELYPHLEILKKAGDRIFLVEATEYEKSLDGVIKVYKTFLEKGVNRSSLVIGIGGGIIQDITGFVCHTFMRGIKWWFLPTTLLAQADSCIGSKTSINFINSKNILGSFYPPRKICIDPKLLNTLASDDLLSGIGEILKVHCMDSHETLAELKEDLGALKGNNPEKILKYISRSLQIKLRYIEDDEFDRGHRLLLNYGHCFGHALEAASEFKIPHGIGVIFGIEFANILSLKRNILPEKDYITMTSLINEVLKTYSAEWVASEKILGYLKKDKKRVGIGLSLILSNGIGKPERFTDISEEEFFSTAEDFRESLKLIFK